MFWPIPPPIYIVYILCNIYRKLPLAEVDPGFAEEEVNDKSSTIEECMKILNRFVSIISV